MNSPVPGKFTEVPLILEFQSGSPKSQHGELLRFEPLSHNGKQASGSKRAFKAKSTPHQLLGASSFIGFHTSLELVGVELMHWMFCELSILPGNQQERISHQEEEFPRPPMVQNSQDFGHGHGSCTQEPLKSSTTWSRVHDHRGGGLHP